MPPHIQRGTRSAGCRFLRNTEGAVAVEFALVFAILVLVVFAAFEFGRAIYFGHAVEFLTDKAARSSIIAADCTLSQEAFAGLRDTAMGISGDALSFTPATAANVYILEVAYNFDLSVPIYGDSVITLSATRNLSPFCGAR